MASDQPFSKIVTDENLMETAQHGSRNYPFAKQETLSLGLSFEMFYVDSLGCSEQLLHQVAIYQLNLHIRLHLYSLQMLLMHSAIR